jgi:6-phosphogluconolactonase
MEGPVQRRNQNVKYLIAKVWLRAAGPLTLAMVFSGCDGSAIQVTPNPDPDPSPAHASAKFLYVVNAIESNVQGFQINAATGALIPSGSAVPAHDAPLYAAATPDGKFLYVANAGSRAIGVSGYRIDPSSGALTATSPAEFPTTGDSQPLGIAVDLTSTHLYTANAQTLSAFNIDPVTGALSDVPGTPVAVPATANLQTVALTPDGRFLYATDLINSRVWEFAISASGLPIRIDTFATAGNSPESIAIDAEGRFAYVANWLSNSISTFTITPGAGVLVSTGAPTPMETGCGPQELTVHPSLKFLFVSCAALNKIARFSIDLSTGNLTSLPSFSTGAFTGPRGIAVDFSGSYLYSAWNMRNKAGTAAVDQAGGLTAVPGTPATGRGPIGVVLSGRQ